MKRKYLFLIVGVGVIALASYWLTKPSQKTPERIQGPAPSGSAVLDAIIVREEPFANVVSVSGSIEPDEQVQLRSEISGIVREILFKEGAQVSKGQLLFKMDDAELQAQYSNALTRQQLAADNETRAKLLLEKEAISSQEYDVAKADLASAKAQTALVQAQLSKTSVHAPFSGKIGLRQVSNGEYLTPQTIVANLIRLDPVKILFAVPEKYSAQIKVGQSIHFQVTGSDTTFKAQIYAIEPGVDAATRTISMRATCPNPQQSLVPGSFARIEIPISRQENAVLVPTQAVIPIQNGKQVYVYRQGKAIAVMVETESRNSNDVFVTSGVSAGDTVLISGLMSLRDGMPAQVQIKGY
jgi:membrane fusion protein (multidrug efflux system)